MIVAMLVHNKQTNHRPSAQRRSLLSDPLFALSSSKSPPPAKRGGWEERTRGGRGPEGPGGAPPLLLHLVELPIIRTPYKLLCNR